MAAADDSADAWNDSITCATCSSRCSGMSTPCTRALAAVATATITADGSTDIRELPIPLTNDFTVLCDLDHRCGSLHPYHIYARTRSSSGLVTRHTHGT
ncbi:hypothetical protein RHRU231_820152 [Rhodococcus ruber]|uniref:Uncharacterized protein n=1 Tax=Rhodococcus ruber TaxID=1830 RepID=A0A098BT20_9NOCA|nr:hypothetical protein RHRU231_820152 [Rhodococcus ruber]